jgi:hypothetical protein
MTHCIRTQYSLPYSPTCSFKSVTRIVTWVLFKFFGKIFSSIHVHQGQITMLQEASKVTLYFTKSCPTTASSVSSYMKTSIFVEKPSIGVFTIAQKSFGLHFYFFRVKLAWTQGMVYCILYF